MCFTPWVSLTTAIIEFAVAIIILTCYRKTIFHKTFAIVLSLLGIYQLSEYMICTTALGLLWGKIGFMAYTLLPGLGLFITLIYLEKRKIAWLALIPAAAFFLFAATTKNFVSDATCGKYFVFLKTMVYDLTNITTLSAIYLIYYLGFIAFIIWLLWKKYKRDKLKLRKQLDLTLLLGTTAGILGAFIFVILIPGLGILFPSVYCQFSLLFAIVAIITAELDKRIVRREKRKRKH